MSDIPATMATRNVDEVRKVFGDQVRLFRTRKRLTQADLAERTDLSLDMIGRIERGVASPSFNSMILIAAELDVPVAVLLGGKPVSTDGDTRKESSLERILATLNALDVDGVQWIERVIKDVLRK